MASIKPLGDKVVVQLIEQEDKTASGIYLPDSAKKKPQRGQGYRRRLRSRPGQRTAQQPQREGRRACALQQVRRQRSNAQGEDYTILDEDQIYAILD